jgi:hypothetical protein
MVGVQLPETAVKNVKMFVRKILAHFIDVFFG